MVNKLLHALELLDEADIEEENNMPVIKTHEEYFCEHCSRMFAIEKTCIDHESTCIEEQAKYANVKKRMVDIDKHNLILFYAKSSEEIDDYVYGYAEDYGYENFEYPTFVLIRKYAETDYEGGYDTFSKITEFDQYIHELYAERDNLIPELDLDL